jgi:hypothetical protein
MVEYAADVRISESQRLDVIDNYLNGTHRKPYMPKGTSVEFRELVARSVTNLTPLLVTIPAQNLFLDGFRVPRSNSQEPVWQVWRANGMNSRQSAIHRGALTFGAHYVTVLPGDPVPVVKQSCALLTTVVYDDDDDDWPVFGVRWGTALRGGETVNTATVYDSDSVYEFESTYNDSAWLPVAGATHGLGVCPIVRYRPSIPWSPTAPARGVIEPLIASQDRLNDTTLNLMMAQSFGSFRQRWISGLPVKLDEDGNPREPFKAGVDRLWQAADPDVKFGDFSQTDLNGYLQSQDKCVLHMSMMAQAPPYYLIGQVANLSADALVAAETGLGRMLTEMRTILGDQHDQTMRLIGRAGGVAVDLAAEPQWRDTEARSISALADALVKLKDLGIPPRALWERLPWATEADLEAWSAMAEELGPDAVMAAVLGTNGGGEDAAEGNDGGEEDDGGA